MYEQVLTFWFKQTKPEQWWIADPAFDALIKSRFLTLLEQASKGELYRWRETIAGRLAEIIILDQFSRNIFRNTADAFSQDMMALTLAQEAVKQELHKSLSPLECSFLLLPYMHSESKLIHIEAEQLYRKFAPAYNYEFELKHKAIIDRFGRYPHRNAILGRASTEEELAFLQQPGSSF
ncbi:MAG TPA: DUF924 family protein [Pseudomonadales bacterium]|nr:DUF924 family protein [Pseudomonadales bacterium]